MLQLIGLLAISWLLIWLFDKSSLTVLGLVPTGSILLLAATLFCVTTVCGSTAFLLKIYFAKEQYVINPNLTATLALKEIWETTRSVLTEELLCRGAGLYVLIKKLGNKRAVIISSVVFGLLHWLNNGVFGNVIQMGIVFAFTFAMGLLLAYSYARTFSILTPFAIHLGWNLTQNFVFPDRPEGNHFFILAAPPPIVTVSYVVFFTMLLFPKVSAIGLDYLLVKRK